MTATPTMEQAWALVRYLEEKLHARVAVRTDALEYQMVRGLVQAATGGRVDVEQLLEHYSQTIGPLIYLAPEHTKDPELLMSVMVHEGEHAYQFARDGLKMTWLYIAEQEGRATYEAHAYAAQIEWAHARHGTVPPKAELGAQLHGAAYGLREEDVRLANMLILQRATSAARGLYAGYVSLLAIGWAQRYAPALLHKV